MRDKRTVGERVDDVVDKVSKDVEKAKGKIATAKGEVSDIAHDISKSVKKAVHDSGDAVSELMSDRKPAAHKHAPAAQKKSVKRKKAS